MIQKKNLIPGLYERPELDQPQNNRVSKQRQCVYEYLIIAENGENCKNNSGVKSVILL